jgi:hypothetical protein
MQLIAELSKNVDPSFAAAIMDSYVEMQQRFMAGDWKPSELDGGRLCEGIARALYQLDCGYVTHTDLPGKLCDLMEDLNNKRTHTLAEGDRRHFCKAIRLAYKLRSDRGPVHISPTYTADFMDSMLILHIGKWILADFLRLAWTKDKRVIADTIAQIVKLEYSLIHELDGMPLVLQHDVSAPVEILLLLNHAEGHKLSREEIIRRAKNNSEASVRTAITRLLKINEIRTTGVQGEIALTPFGLKRVIEKIIPSFNV